MRLGGSNMKKIDKKEFGATKEAPNMVMKLVDHVSNLEEIVEKQQERIKVLEDKVGIDREFEELKAQADELEIDYPGNIKKATLKEKIKETRTEKE